MCGIFGMVSKPGRFKKDLIQTALETIQHRGPDDSGIESFEIGREWEVWLAQRRLSIIDTSAAGHQPMLSRKQSSDLPASAISFNGEIYNHTELRTRYQDRWHYHSQTDTESLLAGLVIDGIEVLRRANGMFAFGFLNMAARELILGRDRLGKKPLYVYQERDLLVFASELKPIAALGLQLEVDEESLAFYRWLGYIPAQKTVYRKCSKFPAASFARISLERSSLPKIKPSLFWDPLKGYGSRYTGTYSDAKAELTYLLDDATRIRLESDVPLGVFLSGGIDSSLVMASVAKQAAGRVSGFTVAFQDPAFDESGVAVATAKYLDSHLELLKLASSDFDRQLAKIPKHYDEPFSDSSQIPTLAIAEAAKKYVSVVLTGDGGDEVFLGYPRYSNQTRLRRLAKLCQIIPGLKPLTKVFINSSLGQDLFIRAMTASGMAGASANLEAKLARFAAFFEIKSPDQVYETIMCIQQKAWMTPEMVNLLGTNSLTSLIRSWYPDYGWDALIPRSVEEQAAAYDLITYLRDDVLVKVDRATMAYGVEARSPLLDYRIVEFGCSLPKEFKLTNGVHKRILRDILAQRVEGDIVNLGKKGFGVPLPKNLPAGYTPQVQWNRFIEQQWYAGQQPQPSKR